MDCERGDEAICAQSEWTLAGWKTGRGGGRRRAGVGWRDSAGCACIVNFSPVRVGARGPRSRALDRARCDEPEIAVEANRGEGHRHSHESHPCRSRLL